MLLLVACTTGQWSHTATEFSSTARSRNVEVACFNGELKVRIDGRPFAIYIDNWKEEVHNSQKGSRVVITGSRAEKISRRMIEASEIRVDTERIPTAYAAPIIRRVLDDCGLK